MRCISLSVLKKVLEFTYPPGSSYIPIANWETKATVNLKHLPPALSICSSLFLKSWVADWNTNIDFFEMLDDDGKVWADLYLQAGKTETSIIANIGREDDEVKIDSSEKLPIFFPQSWVRSCITLDTSTGLARIVVDGKVLEDAAHPKLKNLADKMLANFTIRVGRGAGINAMFTDLNMFSEPPALERLVAITTSGESECGARGDFLNWEEAEWSLSDAWADGAWADWVLVINSSKVEEIEWIRGPCWRETRIRVYQIDNIHDQSYCMNHCKKIANGRSPSVVTEEDWRWLTKEVASISTRNMDHCHLWLAATEGDSGKSWSS